MIAVIRCFARSSSSTKTDLFLMQNIRYEMENEIH